MEIIELTEGIIPFSVKEMESQKFLPYSVYDEKGFYYSICDEKIYKTSQGVFIESVRNVFNSVKTMENERSKKIIQMLKNIPHFQNNRCLQEVKTLQTSFIFKQYNDINYLLKKELEGNESDIGIRKQDVKNFTEYELKTAII